VPVRSGRSCCVRALDLGKDAGELTKGWPENRDLKVFAQVLRIVLKPCGIASQSHPSAGLDPVLFRARQNFKDGPAQDFVARSPVNLSKADLRPENDSPQACLFVADDLVQRKPLNISRKSA
jgi:hypothetical protein